MGQVHYPVPFETSVTDPDSYAGARVARMILGFQGAAALPAVDQMYIHAAAYNDAGEGGFWAIDPEALRHTLVDFDPRGGMHWVIYQNTSSAPADNQIQSTLDVFKVPAACLLYSGGHWVCVNGYTFDDVTKARTAFIINDPAYTGGGADLQVAPAAWDAAYLPVNGGTKWTTKIVEVGDPNPAETEVPWAPRKIVRSGEVIIPAEEAARLAVEGALAFAGENRKLRRALEAGQVGKAQLVARLDRRGSYYYLVPVTVAADRQEQPLAAIMVDGRFGDILSVSAADKPYPLWTVSHEQAREIVTRKPIPIFESVNSATARLMDALTKGAPVLAEAGLTPGLSAGTVDYAQMRQLVRSALTSFAKPQDQIVLQPGEIEIDGPWVWHPGNGASPFHPYYRVRSPWQDVFVNTHTGDLRSQLYSKGTYLGF
jgi:hypothetical protein